MTTNEWFRENLEDQKRPISASSIVDGLRCNRLYFFRSRWAIRPKISPYSKGATTGSLVHDLMKGGREGIEKVHQRVVKRHSKLVERIKAGEDLTGDLVRTANDLNHLYQKALAICTIFWNRFPPKDYMETICREERKESFLPSTTTPAVWIADWIVRDKRDGSVWIRDIKTTGEESAAILTGFLYSIQCRFYRLMTAQEEWGDMVKGFILDIINTPTIKICGKDDKAAAKLGCTPFEAYVQRVKEWYEVQANKVDDAMISVAIVFNEDIHNAEIIDALDTITCLQEQDCTPSNFNRDLTRSRCYWNRRACPYYPLCSSNESAWPSLIEKYYEIREKPETKKGKEEK